MGAPTEPPFSTPFMLFILQIILVLLLIHYAVYEVLARIYASRSVMKSPTGILVLGCAPTLGNGNPNKYFINRLNRAYEVYGTTNPTLIVVSGTTQDGYDEPSSMKHHLVERGIPDAYIMQDPNGYRTVESIKNLRTIAPHIQSWFIVSQSFHCVRAGIIAMAYSIPIQIRAGKNVSSPRARTKMLAREMLSRIGCTVELTQKILFDR